MRFASLTPVPDAATDAEVQSPLREQAMQVWRERSGSAAEPDHLQLITGDDYIAVNTPEWFNCHRAWRVEGPIT